MINQPFDYQQYKYIKLLFETSKQFVNIFKIIVIFKCQVNTI